ncbi:MAG: M1 family aminopeptidase [Candidatus Thiodiazotropha sp.]
MTRKSPICYILLWLALFCKPLFAAPALHHALQVRLDPGSQQLWVRDRVTLAPSGEGEASRRAAGKQTRHRFLLHRGLSPRSLTAGTRLDEIGAIGGNNPLIEYRISMPEDQPHFTLEYGGKIAHRLTTLKESPGRVSERLAGTISQQGVYLDATTGWYPYFPDALLSFELRVELPPSWLAVSQGEGPDIRNNGEGNIVQWHESSPQDDIYLVAAPYHLYRRSTAGIEAQVFLRQRDEATAERYLQATERYLKLYQSLIGPYPYAKFALVENFWESGYGMPSFTLLGPRVLRLPFILHTSYPHEILHNWWGNSVYIDYQRGNWSEGLTSYLADHLLAEQRGRGANHRRTALKRYADFVRTDNDFPLTRFRARHTSASSAVGYDKSLMFFHMLRRHLGDRAFIEGLRIFYRQNRFKTAGFSEIQRAFEEAGGRPLGDLFRQWTERSGAPRLAIGDLGLKQGAEGYRIHGILEQRQSSAPFILEVPILVQMSNGETIRTTLNADQRETPFELVLPAEPLRLQIDPWFDLFRALDPAETPASLSRLFGSERVLILLPSEADTRLLQAYRALAEQWSEGYDAAEIVLDSELDGLPGDRPVWLLGRENRFRHELLGLVSGLPFSLGEGKIEITDSSYDTKGHSFILSERNPDNGQTLAWIVGSSDAALTRLARKLPHYGKYSYLVFEGDQARIALKGEWPVTRSPLQFSFSKDRMAVEPSEPGPLMSLPDQ